MTATNTDAQTLDDHRLPDSIEIGTGTWQWGDTHDVGLRQRLRRRRRARRRSTPRSTPGSPSSTRRKCTAGANPSACWGSSSARAARSVHGGDQISALPLAADQGAVDQRAARQPAAARHEPASISTRFTFRSPPVTRRNVGERPRRRARSGLDAGSRRLQLQPRSD